MTSTMVGRNEWFSVQDIPTKILTWGDGVEELKCGQNLVVLIPGNPGISDFYEQFLAQLHENLRMPVWMISHAGHESPGILDKIHPGSKRLYDLADQVEHKRAVIEEFVPEGCRLYLIGHSVGAKITSELLRKPNVERKIEKCFMLFPTIERIGDTPNAKFIRPFVKYLGSVILILAWIFTKLPEMMRYVMLNTVFKLAYGHPTECVLRGALKLIQPRALENVFYLVKDEMIKIRELDDESFRLHKKKIKLYYGIDDGWSPLVFYENLLRQVPDIDAVVCKNNIKHTFCVQSSTVMAAMVAEWIDETRKEQLSGDKC